jgi:hypothetical protein
MGVIPITIFNPRKKRANNLIIKMRRGKNCWSPNEVSELFVPNRG